MDNSTQKNPITVTNRGGIPVERPVVRSGSETGGSRANSSTSSQPSSPQAPSSPVGKEQEPAGAPFPDVSKMTEAEVKKEELEVERELESFIEKGSDLEKPKIDEEAKKAGLEHAGEDTKMPPVQVGAGVLPMSNEEAELTRKRYKWKDSISWLATLIAYHWKKLSYSDKKKEI
jgi:hypothetical protein